MNRVSVAMAVYNGGKFIEEQLDSIIVQLSDKDEIVISYDESKDDTFQIITKYESSDSRIKVVKNENPGVVGNFTTAIKHCTGEFIFLSDQDDIWLENKLDRVLEEFRHKKTLAVIHDYKLVDETLIEIHPSGFELRGGSGSVLKNLFRLSYIGCCMAFRRSIVEVILPIATKKRSHDWWIGTISGMLGKLAIIRKPYILHRMHENNATPKKRPSLAYQLEVRSLILFNSLLRVSKYKLKKIGIKLNERNW